MSVLVIALSKKPGLPATASGTPSAVFAKEPSPIVFGSYPAVPVYPAPAAPAAPEKAADKGSISLLTVF